MPHSQEKCITGAKVCGAAKFAECTDLYRDGDREERGLNHAASVELPCLRLRARFAARKNTVIRRETRSPDVYGFTWTLASLVTNWIGRCRESLAFTCTIDSRDHCGGRGLPEGQN